MKKQFFIFSLLTIIGIIALTNSFQNEKRDQYPKPTDGTILYEGHEEGKHRGKRQKWFELMHQADPDTDWRNIEYQTSYSKHLKRVEARSDGRSDDVVDIGTGQLMGKWHERGSNNQAGNVKATDYYPESDEIYVISDGGSLFKGDRYNGKWQIVNQDLKFESDLLEMIETVVGTRMIAIINKKPHYSDDLGQTWAASSGIPIINSSWGFSRGVVLEQDSSNFMLFLSKTDYWAPLKVYESLDNGESFQWIQSLGSHDASLYHLFIPTGGGDIFMAANVSDLATDMYRYNPQAHKLEIYSTSKDALFGSYSNDQTSGRAPVNMQGVASDTSMMLYAYTTFDTVKYSLDTGITWTSTGQIPEHPWSYRFFVFPSNPDILIAGGVELYRSIDRGKNWSVVNRWWEYYDFVESKLHADMMYFEEFMADDSTYFTLISNHGGLSITYDYTLNNDNIGMDGLNVSQYYSVRTDNLNRSVMYAGTQDQGFQRGLSDADTAANFKQLISGDYGHIVFSDNGIRLWTVYPYGSVSYYNFPIVNSGPTAWWELDSENESVWIPPLAESPFTENNEIFMAGGNINGGPGAHLIKLTYNGSNIEAEQNEFDFYENSGGEVGSIAFSKIDPSIIYVGTTNGAFYFSTNGGVDWTESQTMGPGVHYLYGNAILPSRLDHQTVFFVGSGYSNPPVFASHDNGLTFEPMDDGLPSTLVFNIVSNQDESMLFAATEAGPYVYLFSDEKWYDLSGTEAPLQRYWSVEFLDDLNRVRYGTYGRGIWDFEILDQTGSSQPITRQKTWVISPNPSSGVLRMANEENLSADQLIISNINGQTVYSDRSISSAKEIELSNIPPGQYIIRIITSNNEEVHQWIRQ